MRHKKKYHKNKTPKRRSETYVDGIRQKILDAKLPIEAVLKDSLITAVGQSELWIENYKSLLEYTEEQISIQAGGYVIKVEGERLNIQHYMEEHMMICGKIRSITYL
jgi:sporulation protein YqfC